MCTVSRLIPLILHCDNSFPFHKYQMKSRYRRDGARAWHAGQDGDEADVESDDDDDDGSVFLREGRMRGGYSPVSSYDSRSVPSYICFSFFASALRHYSIDFGMIFQGDHS